MRKLKEFTCEMCGGKFHSYANHAKYCKYCRDKKQVERVQAHQDKLKSGTARQIGSEQVCPQCGKTFVLKPESKVCEECAKKECTKNYISNPNLSYDTIHIYVPKGEKVKYRIG